MQQNEQAQHEPKATKSDKKISDRLRCWLGSIPRWLQIATVITGILIGGVIVFISITVILLLVSFLLDTKVSDRVVFITANLLNVLILIAIMAQVGIYLIQANIYKQQRDIMKRQGDYFEATERGYIGVRRMALIGFDEGFKQIGVQVTFRNGGRSPAFKFRAHASISVGNAPERFTWEEVTPDVKRVFIPGSEDRKIVFSHVGLIDGSTVLGQSPTKQLFIDGEARYDIIGNKEIILCFGSTYHVSEDMFESRYQYERDT